MVQWHDGDIHWHFRRQGVATMWYHVLPPLPLATEVNDGQRSGNEAGLTCTLAHFCFMNTIRNESAFSLWWISLAHSWILTQTHNCVVRSQSIKANTKVHTSNAKESFTWFWVVVYSVYNFWRPYSREFEWAVPVNTKLIKYQVVRCRYQEYRYVSLVPRPHPLTRRNGLVNQVEFLGLVGALVTM